MAKAFSQFCETDNLKSVIIGRWEGYAKVKAYSEILNKRQKKGLYSETQLKQEFDAFRGVLEKYGVEVHVPDYVGKFVFDQLTPRDVAAVIGNKLILCDMANKSRKYEVAGIFPLIEDFTENEPNVIIPPAECLLEAGDIMVDKGRLMVGISNRTNLKGFEWLHDIFGDEMEVVPVFLTIDKSEDVLHLDLTFNPVGENSALIYEEGLNPIPEFMSRDYNLIKVEKDEQQELVTNVLSISKETIISRDHPLCKRVNEEVRKRGIKVEEIQFDGGPATGGSLRCCSLPLIREKES